MGGGLPISLTLELALLGVEGEPFRTLHGIPCTHERAGHDSLFHSPFTQFQSKGSGFEGFPTLSDKRVNRGAKSLDLLFVMCSKDLITWSNGLLGRNGVRTPKSWFLHPFIFLLGESVRGLPISKKKVVKAWHRSHKALLLKGRRCEHRNVLCATVLVTTCCMQRNCISQCRKWEKSLRKLVIQSSVETVLTSGCCLLKNNHH